MGGDREGYKEMQRQRGGEGYRGGERGEITSEESEWIEHGLSLDSARASASALVHYSF